MMQLQCDAMQSLPTGPLHKTIQEEFRYVITQLILFGIVLCNFNCSNICVRVPLCVCCSVCVCAPVRVKVCPSPPPDRPVLCSPRSEPPPLWQGKAGSICHLTFPLFCSVWGPKIPKCWDKQHATCHCHSPFWVPPKLVKTWI